MLNHKFKSFNQAQRSYRWHPCSYRWWLTIFMLASSNCLTALSLSAASPPPGTVIENQATGSFTDPSDDTEKAIESNIVRVEIAEVAGITITGIGTEEAPSNVGGAGANQDNGTFNPDDVVYFTYQITNVGNDPTQFFIPGAPSSITGGSLQGNIEIIGYDPDGSGATAATDLSSSPVQVPADGINTGDANALNLPDGSIPADGTVTIRVPVKLNSTLNDGATVTVVMGDTGSNDNTPETQNQVYSAGTNDVYTQDNPDGTTGEANGNPINGDATNQRQEASYSQEVTVTVSTAVVPPPADSCPTEPIGLVDFGVSTSSGSGSGIGRQIRYPNVATVDGKTLDLIGEVTALQNINNLEAFGINGNGLANITLPDTNASDPQGTIYSAEVEYTFVETGTATPVPVSFEFEISDIDNNLRPTATSRREFIVFSTSEFQDYFFSNPTQMQAEQDTDGIQFSNSVEVNDNPDPSSLNTVKFLMNNRSSFTMTFGVEKKTADRRTGRIGFGLDGAILPQVGKCPRYDFGDAPDEGSGTGTNNYETLQENNGPYHEIKNGIYLGAALPDADNNGTPTTGADGDDNSNSNVTFDDEDAFNTLPNVPSVGSNYSLNVPLNTNGNATLHGWIDFNKNGKFEADEYQSAAVTSINTEATLTWSVPLSTIPGSSYVRLRLTSDALSDSIDTSDIDERSVGRASDGEVEDYPVTIEAAPIYDYGDAPDTSSGTGTGDYQTTSTNGGAAQVAIDEAGRFLSLGDDIDVDSGNLQGTEALEDDTIGAPPDDEDGVTSFPTLTTTEGQTYTVTVSARNNVPAVPAYLVGFIDFNKDGDFLDEGEQSATVEVTSDFNAVGTDGVLRDFEVTFTTPAGMTPGDTYARFRLGQVEATAKQATGASAGTDNGEVEDYKIAIASPGLDFGDAPNDSNDPDADYFYTEAKIQPSNSIYLGNFPPDSDAGNWDDGTDDSQNATDDDTNGTPIADIVGDDEEDGIVYKPLNLSMAGQSFEQEVRVNNSSGAEVYVKAWIDFDRNGTFDTDEASNEVPVAANAGDTTAELTFSIPSNSANSYDGLSPGPSFARVIISDTPGIPKSGQGTGEIEDHIINIGDTNICNPASGPTFSAFDFSDVSGNIGENLNLSRAEAIYKNAAVDLDGIPIDVKTTVEITNNDGQINKFGNGTEDGRDEFEWYAAVGNTDNNAEANVTLEFFVAGTNTPRNISGQFATGDIDGKPGARTEVLLLKTDEFSSFILNDPTDFSTPPSTTQINGDNYTVFQGTQNRSDDPESFVVYTFDSRSSINLVLRAIDVTGTRSAGFPINGRLASTEITNANCTTPTASVPELLLVKRITAINPGQSDEQLFDNDFVSDGIGSDNWPTPETYLRGATEVTGVKPGDEVEYTIYFLSDGDKPANKVQICDAIPDNMTFVKDLHGVEVGIGLELTTDNPPSTANPPSREDPNILLSNVVDDEKGTDNLAQGAFYAPGTDPNVFCEKLADGNPPTFVDVNGENNTSGAVWVQLNNPLPPATSAGDPANSYGFIRFRARVK